MNNQITIFIIYICITFFCNISFIKAQPQVKVKQGILKGDYHQTVNGRNFSAFLGIPYGKPPVGRLRFRSPEPADNWDGVFRADSYGEPCINTLFGLLTAGQEDCLNLDIYTPFLEFEDNKLTNTTLLPVMVYISGGAFFFGGSNIYNGSYILDKDVLLMIFNYRLGIFGFLSTGDAEAPGNFGMKDQVLALKWVQENIKNFGGDPNRVTIFGVSSGSVSVHLHALSNASNGLFQQYIMQSGTALSTFGYRRSNDIFESVKRVAKFVSCPVNPTKKLVNCLRRKDAKYLLAVSNLLGSLIRVAEFTWVPTNEPESKDAFLTVEPENLMDQMKDLPFISGVMTDETLTFMNGLYSYDLVYQISKKIWKRVFFDDAVYFNKKGQRLPPKLVEFYLDNVRQSDHRLKVLEVYKKVFSDATFIYPELKMLKKITPKMKNANYLYSFGYRNTYALYSLLSRDNTNYGVAHGEDLANFFPVKYGFVDTSILKYSANDIKIRNLMIDLWTSFATNGVPKSKEMDVEWKPYNTYNNTHLQIGNIEDNKDPTVKLSHNFYTQRMEVWQKYLPL